MKILHRKLVFALSLLLIASQWLTLAHASEHSIDGGEVDCQVCTLQHHFQSATVDTTPALQTVSPYTHLPAKEPLFQSTTPDPDRLIRAPPQ